MNGQEGIPKSISAFKKVLRVRKQDSAFLYFVLESWEGATAYRTLDGDWGALYRDVELIYSPDFCREVDAIIQSLGELVWVPTGT